EFARSEGIDDFEKIFKADDLILTNDVAIAATGVTDGKFLEGVDLTPNGAITHSFIARGQSHTYRKLETRHFFDYKPIY
ncbi:MAG: fructose-bisphosphatase class II, partial [SAR324 cluster bacterium]|nr:fructose-bisphosphatase class II [SAR324 cluster bacterium]